MKRLSRLLIPPILILLLCCMAAVPCTATTTSGNGNPVNVVTDGLSTELKNPLLSFCASPGWKLANLYVINPGEDFNADHCVQFVAVQTSDTTLCSGIKRGAPKTKCIAMIAGSKNDPAVCNKMPSTSDPQAYLKIDCLWEVAVRNNNPAGCNAIGSQKISRMFIGEMSRETCLARLESGVGVGASTL